MLLELLNKIVSALEERDIAYMLSGSLAMNIYSTPRMTRDIDIVIDLKPIDIDSFSEIFGREYYIYKEGIAEEVQRKGMFNIIDFHSGQKIDFIIKKDTEFHIHEFDRKQRSGAYGFPLWVVSAEDLILAKLHWIQELQSDTQMRDIQNLLEDQYVNTAYIREWVDKLNLTTFGLL